MTKTFLQSYSRQAIVEKIVIELTDREPKEPVSPISYPFKVLLENDGKEMVEEKDFYLCSPCDYLRGTTTIASKECLCAKNGLTEEKDGNNCPYLIAIALPAAVKVDVEQGKEDNEINPIVALYLIYGAASSPDEKPKDIIERIKEYASNGLRHKHSDEIEKQAEQVAFEICKKPFAGAKIILDFLNRFSETEEKIFNNTIESLSDKDKKDVSDSIDLALIKIAAQEKYPRYPNGKNGMQDINFAKKQKAFLAGASWKQNTPEQDGWFDVREKLPERIKGKKTIVQGWDGKCQYTLQYVFPKTETIDTEDFKDDFNYDESDYDSDEKAGETYLKEGFWEECENSGYHDYMWYKRNITHWRNLHQPPNSNNTTP